MKKVQILAAAAVLGVGVGSASLAFAADTSGSSTTPSPTYTLNKAGQTIGNVVTGVPAPDLIPIDTGVSNVQMNKGAVAAAGPAGPATGYIYSRDLNPPPPTDPAMAAKQTQSRLDANGDIWVPVYAEDGTTVLGRFLAGHVTIGDSSSN